MEVTLRGESGLNQRRVSVHRYVGNLYNIRNGTYVATSNRLLYGYDEIWSEFRIGVRREVI